MSDKELAQRFAPYVDPQTGYLKLSIEDLIVLIRNLAAPVLEDKDGDF